MRRTTSIDLDSTGNNARPVRSDLLVLNPLSAFRVILTIGVIGLGMIIVRNWLVSGRPPWTDFANLAVVLISRIAVSASRIPWRILAWIVLLSLFLNAAWGLTRGADARMALLLLPLLVLYGALLGDLVMSVAALVAILSVYVAFWLFSTWRPLDPPDLAALAINAVVTGMAGFGVWLQHRKAATALAHQTVELRRELDLNLRLSAVLSHDLANPLSALAGYVSLAQAHGVCSTADLDEIARMANRMQQIIKSSRELTHTPLFDVEADELEIGLLVEDLRQIFGLRLLAKNQTLRATTGLDFTVRTNAQYLCNSVLCNLVSNAIKFTPAGGTIEISAERSPDQTVTLFILDQGPGFSADELRDVVRGRTVETRPGTEGETGTGMGLRIAALYAERLHASLVISNREGGGGAVGIRLPAGNEPGRGFPSRK